MALPTVYVDAAWRNTTPVCPERNRFGVAFDAADMPTVRLALTPSDAGLLVDALRRYISDAALTQSPGSPLISSDPKSVPAEGVNV